MSEQLWVEHQGDGPVLATAVHAGHAVRKELLPLLAIDASARSREEDPYTDYFVRVVPSWIVPERSRFEVDLNRSRDTAVYDDADVAWGLHVWQQPLDEATKSRSLAEYDLFYQELARLLDNMAEQYRYFVILDVHSYNYRRAGPEANAASPQLNPEINIGTGTLNHALFGDLLNRFMLDLRRFDFFDSHLDVRENVKFKGRHVAEWVHKRYPESACVLSIEFKKFYMDEWTGVGDIEQIEQLRLALQSTLPGLLSELDKLKEEE